MVITVTLVDYPYDSYSYTVPVNFKMPEEDVECSSCTLDPASLDYNARNYGGYHSATVYGSNNYEETYILPVRGYELSKIQSWSD